MARRVAGASDLHTLTLHVHWVTEWPGGEPKAWRVSDTGEDDDGVWLPASQVEVDPPSAVPGQAADFTAPEWLLKDRGLL